MAATETAIAMAPNALAPIAIAFIETGKRPGTGERPGTRIDIAVETSAETAAETSIEISVATGIEMLIRSRRSGGRGARAGPDAFLP